MSRLLPLCAGLLAPAAAVAASPTIESVVPAVGQAGKEFVVVLAGARLKEAREVVFYGTGLECSKLVAASENEVRATLRASADCPIGPHPFRVRTPGGLSELKVVHVSPLPVVAEVETNDAPRSAQAIAPNTTVAGVIDSGDVDVFAVALRKGDRLSAEVQAVRLGGEMTDAILTILGPRGEALATADDGPITRQDPAASIVAPADGTYTILIRETSFGGRPTSTYALHVGDFPRPSAVFPPGARSGRRARLRLLGAPEPAIAEVDVPGIAGPWWDYYPRLAGGPSPTPVPIRVRPYDGFDEPDLTEVGPPPASGVEAREWPVAFHGVIAGPGDVDAFAIKARAGDRVRVEVFAARLGSPLDTVVEVLDGDGDLVARNDDDASHDSRLIFKAPADGTYRIVVADKRREGGRGFVYRVEVEEPRPALTLFLAGPVRKSQTRQVVAIPRGNRVVAYLGVRRDGFDAPVGVRLGGLPEGVTADLKDVAAGTYLVPVVFEAAADAPLGARLVKVEGLASTPSGTVSGGFRQVVDLIQGPGDSSYESATLDRLAVVVTDPAPYSVSLSAPTTPLARDGAIELVAKVGRAGGFDGPIEVSLPFLPPGVEMDGPGIVPPGRSEAVLKLSARADADPVGWRLAAEARPAPPRVDRRDMTLALMAQLDPATGGRRRRVSAEGMTPVASKFVELDLAPSPFAGRFEPTAAEQGQSATVTCLLDPSPAAAGPMVATLEGLPPRATAAPVEIAPGARRVEFRVVVAATTPAGEHDSLVCRLAGKADGREVVRRVGRGGVLKINPPGALATGADGKPLSPLEALRLRERKPRPAAKTP